MWSVHEQALYWTDNLGKRIHRLEPESGNDASFALSQDVMDIGLACLDCGITWTIFHPLLALSGEIHGATLLVSVDQ